MNPFSTINRRRHERFTLPPMYSPVRVRREQRMSIAPIDGHAYDISEGGMRFECDQPLAVGELVSVELELPACCGTVRANGRVVRVTDAEDDPGQRPPHLAAMQIERFHSHSDHDRLLSLFQPGALQRAA